LMATALNTLDLPKSPCLFVSLSIPSLSFPNALHSIKSVLGA
jgi:hypothetical protein